MSSKKTEKKGVEEQYRLHYCLQTGETGMEVNVASFQTYIPQQCNTYLYIGSCSSQGPVPMGNMVRYRCLIVGTQDSEQMHSQSLEESKSHRAYGYS